MDIKVVIEQRMLPGSDYSGGLQKVATVYIDGDEYRVLAPGAAKGDALKWLGHVSVRMLADDGLGGDYELSHNDERHRLVMTVVEEELNNHSSGVHPDGTHCAAQICLKGHVLPQWWFYFTGCGTAVPLRICAGLKRGPEEFERNR